MTASCNAGDILLGGGFRVSNSGGGQLDGSHPNASSDGWTVTFQNQGDGTAYALCGKLTG